ncbi:MAG: FixH family protein [Alphaproteobacteria bacterium]|nr:FixH family protein [Alphaproteobacteria bacterium]
MRPYRPALLWAALLLAACGDRDTTDDSQDTATYEELREIDAGPYSVSWAPVPDPIPFNDYFAVNLEVKEGGSPLTDAVVTVDAGMPAHGHGMNVTPTVTDNGDGTWTADGLLFHMEGHWELKVDVNEEQAVFDITCCAQ